MQLCSMAEIEKKEVEFPACATLWQGNCIRWQHLIFLFIYIVQLYKEDWGTLHMLGCQALALQDHVDGGLMSGPVIMIIYIEWWCE